MSFVVVVIVVAVVVIVVIVIVVIVVVVIVVVVVVVIVVVVVVVVIVDVVVDVDVRKKLSVQVTSSLKLTFLRNGPVSVMLMVKASFSWILILMKNIVCRKLSLVHQGNCCKTVYY